MISVGTAVSMTRWNSKGEMTTMTKTLPLWAALLFGVICGAVIGTIVAAFVLGLTETAVAVLIDPGLTLAASYILFLIILVVRPEGLFGRRTA